METLPKNQTKAEKVHEIKTFHVTTAQSYSSDFEHDFKLAYFNILDGGSENL